MRGFLVAALVLIGLDVALSAPASRITALFALPGGWLAEWMDPGRPLIGTGHLADASASSSSSSSSAALGAVGGFINPLQAAQEIGAGLATAHK